MEREIILEKETDEEQVLLVKEETVNVYPELENLEVTPSKEEQIFNHEGFYGYDEVKVKAIPDTYIEPTGVLEIIKNGEYDVKVFEKANVNIEEKEDLTNELTEQNNLISTQETTIEDIVLALENKGSGGIDTSDATATSDDLLLGKTAYANEEKLTGTIETYDGAMSDGAEVENSLVDFLNNKKTHYTKKDLEGATSIKHYMWYQNNSIISVELPDSVLSLEQRAFSVCNNLERIVLPKNLTTISTNVFNGCSSLMEVICLATTPPTLNATAFTGVPENCVIKVPSGSVDAYKTATNWSVRADYIVAYEEV